MYFSVYSLGYIIHFDILELLISLDLFSGSTELNKIKTWRIELNKSEVAWLNKILVKVRMCNL